MNSDTSFKKKSDLHLPRKIWHMGGVLILYLIWTRFSYPINIYIFAAIWLAFVPPDIFRQYSIRFRNYFNQFFKLIMRSSEVDKLAGTTYLLTSVLFISILFSSTIVSLSLLFLAFADPLASYFGIKFGRHKIFGHKSIEGFLAAFVVCTGITFLSLKNRVESGDQFFLLVALSGLCGALAELIPIGKMDDNFTMPILSSICLYFLFIFFNIPL